MKRFAWLAPVAFLGLSALFSARASMPDYSIQAIRYASGEAEVADLVMGGPAGEKINIAMIIWLVRGGGRNILFDSGYHRDTFLKDFALTGYIRPDEAVKLAGVRMDPPPSLAVPKGTIPDDTAAAVPPLDPPGVRLRSHGLRVTPRSGLAV